MNDLSFATLVHFQGRLRELDSLFRSQLLTPACFRAIPHLIPVFRPLLAPGKGSTADGADLRGEILLGGLRSGLAVAARHYAS